MESGTGSFQADGENVSCRLKCIFTFETTLKLHGGPSVMFAHGLGSNIFRIYIQTFSDMLAELSRRERDANIKPDPDLDIFMKAASTSGQEETVVTDYTLKV
ncbi:hypothetical protein Tco_0894812 [Tanacetum coccineum]|uniref:Uncharacterized protein n=1 Tax=Tanacetum coccineum TaxID=301880 RepID=A0ABQ5CD63_9ASTR